MAFAEKQPAGIGKRHLSRQNFISCSSTAIAITKKSLNFADFKKYGRVPAF
jgi:hypothetical protein